MPREDLRGFLGDVKGAQRKVSRDLLLKEEQEFARWKSEGKAFHKREQHVQRPRRMCVIAKTVLGYDLLFES